MFKGTVLRIIYIYIYIISNSVKGSVGCLLIQEFGFKKLRLIEMIWEICDTK
jgi:hypothetical protein